MEKSLNRSTKWLIVIGAISLAIIALILSIYFWEFHGGLSDDNAKWGTFGEYVGGSLGAIFGFTNFVLLLYNFIQTRDIANQQNKDQLIKRFEDTFFKLIDLHNLSIEPLVMNNKMKRQAILEAIMVFERIPQKGLNISNYEELKKKSSNSKEDKFGQEVVSNGDLSSMVSDMSIALNLTEYSTIQKVFLHYVRNLSALFKLMTQYSAIIDKSIYLSIITSVLTVEEQYFIVYFVNDFCFDKNGIEIETFVSAFIIDKSESKYRDITEKNEKISLLLKHITTGRDPKEKPGNEI